MSNQQNDIIRENIKEMIEEENIARLNLEEAVLDEQEEETIKELAIAGGAYPEERI